MELKFLGHSAVEINFQKESILIDPFITDNPLCTLEANSFNPSHILLSHAHGDHVGDTEAIAKRCGSKIISTAEIVSYYQNKALDGHPMNIGGQANFSFGKVKFTPAWHSSSFPDGSYGGMPMGMVIEAEGKRIYHAGDTALFGDMSLIGKLGIDLAFLPIGDNFTMGPEDALEAVKLIRPKTVVPIHYDTFGFIKQDAKAFQEAVAAETDSHCIVLAPAEVFRLN